MGQSRVISTIDVGTNSVLLLIVRVEDAGKLTVLADEANITRIGEGIAKTGVFSPVAMDRTLKVLEHYADLCRKHAAEKIIAVGTAAFRRVSNGAEFIATVRRECGFELEVISGEREATLSFLAAERDFGIDSHAQARGNLPSEHSEREGGTQQASPVGGATRAPVIDILVCDIGGGSTEYIWRPIGLPQIKPVSLPLGSVVLHEQKCTTDPISDREFEEIRTSIASELRPGLGSGLGVGASTKLIALAGTATTLGAMHKQLRTYNHWEVHGTELALQDVEAITQTLRSKTLAERKKLPGLEPARADVILCGALILLETMRLLGYKTVTISDHGVRWGLVYAESYPFPPNAT